MLGEVERPGCEGVRSSTTDTGRVGRETDVVAGLVADLDGMGGGGAGRAVDSGWTFSAGRGGIMGRGFRTAGGGDSSIGPGLPVRSADSSSKGSVASSPRTAAEAVELTLPLRLGSCE